MEASPCIINRKPMADISDIVEALSNIQLGAKPHRRMAQFKNLERGFDKYVYCKNLKERKTTLFKRSRRNNVSQIQLPPATEREDLRKTCTDTAMKEVKPLLEFTDVSDARSSLDFDEIYNFYYTIQIAGFVPIDYMPNQTEINHKMRAIVVDWLIEVHQKFDLVHETLFLAINLIDRYLSRKHVIKRNLQLLGITAIFVACKYEQACAPSLDDLVYISDGSCTRHDVLQMEKSMISTLNFDMFAPTSAIFVRRLLTVAQSDSKLEMAALYLLELSLVEYHMLKFPPSLLSAAAIYIGRCFLKKSPPWNQMLMHYSTYSEDQLQECVKLMAGLLRNAGQGRLTAVFGKYSSSKYGCISLLMKSEAHH